MATDRTAEIEALVNDTERPVSLISVIDFPSTGFAGSANEVFYCTREAIDAAMGRK